MSDDAATFKPGDLVVLKSGGPIMTVDYIGAREHYDGEVKGRSGVHCVWFNRPDYGYELNDCHVSAATLRPAATYEIEELMGV